MLISTKGRYALRVLVDIAENNKEGYTPLKEIANRQGLSEKYLENIIPVLIRNDFLVGLRGKGGGYKLTRPPETYTVGSVLKLVEGGLSAVSCLEVDAQSCERAASCRTMPMWQKLQDKLDDFFEGITIADLCQDGQESGDA
ncbi:MAG: Rrf2 family transcriptional regulator [Oscillospiraceae bacterium]|nr:Rrf2 family transcriptional regulator [Oscillospiraceae bacterium]